MYVFGNDKKARGCFHGFNILEAIPQGAILSLPDGKKMPPSKGAAAADPYFVTGIEFAHKEKYHLVECFNDTVHTYAFGFDPKASLITVNFVGFMMKKSGTGVSDVFSTMLGAYGTNRLSQNQKLATVYLGGQGILQGFIVALSSSTAEQQHNLQNFSMTLLAVEAQSGAVEGEGDNNAPEGGEPPEDYVPTI